MVFKSKQRFRTFEVVSTYALFGLCIALSAQVIIRSQVSKERYDAEYRAQHLAHQLLGGRSNFEKNTKKPKRGLASIENNKLGLFANQGIIGKDPWGEAYRYEVLLNQSGVPTHLAVWSAGPNLKNETDLEPGVDPALFQLMGDDVGTLHPIGTAW